MSNVAEYRAKLIAAFDARKLYESDKNSENTSIQKTLDDMRKSVDHDKIAEVMMLSNVDADFINKSERITARFNVYSAEKIVNLARTLASAAQLNHYTRAIFLSALALEKHEMTLTHKDASAACTLSIKNNAARDKLLVRYQKHVAANTAATQSSSSINALQMFDVFTETRDEMNNVAYRVNTENEAAKKLTALFNV